MNFALPFAASMMATVSRATGFVHLCHDHLRAIVVARPMPKPPPVTMITLSLNRCMVCSFLLPKAID
jgi:hypothetical protein